MALFTKLQSIGSLKALVSSIFISKTDKADKVADNGVLNGLFYGISKVGQKAIKDIAIIESELFVQEANGDSLDTIAQNKGVPTRLGALPSSCYVRVVGDVGTIYQKGTSKFYSNQILFDLQESVTIGDNGYAYASVVCTQQGGYTNVDAGTINSVNPIPTGHLAVFNEYQAVGGRDEEDDNTFRNRIINSSNLLSLNTKDRMLQNMISVNHNILRVWFFGRNNFGQQVIRVATQNGAILSTPELDALYEGIKDKLSIEDSFGIDDDIKGVVIENMEYQYVDISMRIQRDESIDPDQIRKNIQLSIQKNLDFRYWKMGKTIEWEDLYIASRGIKGVLGIPSQYFYPNFDIKTSKFKLPIVRGFELRDNEGNIISSNNNAISPIYYPNEPNIIFNQTFNNG